MLFSETQRQWRAPNNYYLSYHNSMKKLHKVKKNVKIEKKIINFKELNVKKINKSTKIAVESDFFGNRNATMHFKTIQM